MKRNRYLISIVSCIIILLISGVYAQQGHNFETVLKSGSTGRFILADTEFIINKIPNSVNEFTTLRNTISKDPRGGYALFLIAMMTYQKNPELGTQFFTIAIDRSKLRRGSSGPQVKGYSPDSFSMTNIRRLKMFPYLANVYITGTKHTNGYQLPSLPYTIRFRQATIRGNKDITLYCFTTSGNSARPITLRKNSRGYWKAFEFSSVFVGVMRTPPKKQIDDDI